MSLFTDIIDRRNQLLEKNLKSDSLVLITNRRTIHHILAGAGGEKLIKNSSSIKKFYGMKVIITKSDNCLHDNNLHFEICELINDDKEIKSEQI